MEKATSSTDWTLSLLTMAFVVVLLTLIAVHATRYIKRMMFYLRLPSLKYSPLYGNIDRLDPLDGESMVCVLRELMEDVDPKMAIIWMSPITPHLVVYHPDSIKDVVLSSAAYKPRGVGKGYEFGLKWIGEGLITANGTTWSRSRRLLNPAFHNKILKNYMDIYNKSVDILMKKLDGYAETGEPFDAFIVTNLCNLDITLKCILGYDDDVQSTKDGLHPYAQAVIGLTDTWSKRFWSPLIWPEIIFKHTSRGKEFYKLCDYVHKVADDVMKNRMESRSDGEVPEGKYLDFIDILLSARDEDGQPMSPLEIRNQVDTIMFAGHDTTSASLSFGLYNLAKHQDYQKKIQDEVDALFDGRDTDDLLWEDLSQLEMTGLCMKESQRIYSPVPMTGRMLMKDLDIGGTTFPKGTTVQLSLFNLHRNPAVWEKPLEYFPERFKSSDYSKYAFTPFSTGPRNCIGQIFSGNVERVVLSKFFNRFHVDLAPGFEGPKLKFATILKSQNGVMLTVRRREKQ